MAAAAIGMVAPCTPAVAGVIQGPAQSWAPVADAARYEVQVRPHAAPWTQAQTLFVPQPVWQPQDLSMSGRVDWRARAVTESGAKGAWIASGTTTLSKATPARPRNLKAKRSGVRISLSWKAAPANDAVTGYAVYWSKDGSRWKPLSEVTGTHAVLRSNPRSGYWFMVAAKNAAGESQPHRIHVSR